MFKRILVPLDGSLRAEQAIPLAARLARATGGSILLVQIVDTFNTFGASSAGAAVFLPELLEQEGTKAHGYLAGIAESNELKSMETRIAVFRGQAAPSLIDVAHQQEIDVIVLCSHGRTGAKRWALGSVAQKVARYSPVPVLVLHEGTGGPTSKQHPRRVMVALDGSPLAESALLPAAQLSAALSAPLPGALHLVRVLPVSTAFEYGQEDAVAKARRQDTQDAQISFREIQKRLLEDHPTLSIMTSLATSLDTAETLIAIAETGAGEGMSAITSTSDIIALATHGRSGPARWVMGSVTERILGATRLPLLIVRPPLLSRPDEPSAQPEDGWVGLR